MDGWKHGCRRAALWMFVWLSGTTLAVAQSALPAPWVGQDIGSPAIHGSSTFTAPASFTVKSAAADIWGASDQFHFVYVPISGNVDVRARVDSIAPTSVWAKTGVMIRASLAANSAHAFSLVSYSKGLAFQRRPATGGSSVHTAGEAAGAPRWVRLVRAGNVVTSYSSANGVTWTTIDTATIQLGTTAYVGIAATSRNANTVGSTIVSQVSLSLPSTLPAGQASADIGSPAVTGSASYSGGSYTISAGGTDIWGASDQFHYVYQQASGDLDVKVRIASVSYADQWSKAGVMIRASLAPGSAHAFALASAGKGYAFQRRATDGDLSFSTAGPVSAPPGWVRLRRSGTLITAYQSQDGVTWNTIGSASIAIGDNVYVGIAATSHAGYAATTINADNFSLSQVAPAPTPPANRAPTVSLTTNGTTFTAPATITLTAAASDPENQMARVEFYAGTTLLGTDAAAPYSFTWSGAPVGTHVLKAIAFDTLGATGTSATVTATVNGSTSAPVKVAFTTTAADMGLATSYLLEFFASTADPSTATPIAKLSLGKPPLDATGTATVDISTVFNGLAAGTYVATVSAVWSGGVSRSATVSVTK